MGTMPASVTKRVTEWLSVGVSSVNWAEPGMKAGEDTFLDRRAAFWVVLFRGAADTVRGSPALMAGAPELGNVAPRIRSGAIPVTWGTTALGKYAWSSTAEWSGTV